MTTVAINKKALWIGAAVSFAVVMIFGLAAYRLYPGQEKNIQGQVQEVKTGELPNVSGPVVKQLSYTDPLGFTLSYPENYTLDNHPEDKVNYANVEIFNQEKTGSIKIIVSDTSYTDINTWAKNDISVRGANFLDTTIGNVSGKKSYIADTKKMIAAGIWDGMLLKLEIFPSDDQEIVRTGEKILTGLSLSDAANYTSEPIIQDSASVVDEGSGNVDVEEIE